MTDATTQPYPFLLPSEDQRLFFQYEKSHFPGQTSCLDFDFNVKYMERGFNRAAAHYHTLVDENAHLNNIPGRIEVRAGDMFAPVKPNETFDLIIGEMPFIPVDPAAQEKYIAQGHHSEILNISGGADGRHFIDIMITQSAPLLNRGGSLVFIQPSFVGVSQSLDLLAQHGLEGSVFFKKPWMLHHTKFTQSNRGYIEKMTGYSFPKNDHGESYFEITMIKGKKVS